MNSKEMCDTCRHNQYCMAAYKKDHWCGNHTGWRNSNGESIDNMTAMGAALGNGNKKQRNQKLGNKV